MTNINKSYATEMSEVSANPTKAILQFCESRKRRLNTSGANGSDTQSPLPTHQCFGGSPQQPADVTGKHSS